MFIVLAKVALKPPPLSCLARFKFASAHRSCVPAVKVGPSLLHSAFNQVRCKAQISVETAPSAEKDVGDSNVAKVRKMRVALWVGYTGTDFKGASSVLHCARVVSFLKQAPLPA